MNSIEPHDPESEFGRSDLLFGCGIGAVIIGMCWWWIVAVMT